MPTPCITLPTNMQFASTGENITTFPLNTTFLTGHTGNLLTKPLQRFPKGSNTGAGNSPPDAPAYAPNLCTDAIMMIPGAPCVYIQKRKPHTSSVVLIAGPRTPPDDFTSPIYPSPWPPKTLVLPSQKPSLGFCGRPARTEQLTLTNSRLLPAKQSWSKSSLDGTIFS